MKIDVKALNQMFNYVDKMNDLMIRSFSAYPVRRDVVALKNRYEAGDPNVVVYLDEHGGVDRYELVFTTEKAVELERAYKEATGDRPDADFESGVFVGILQSWGNAIPDLISVEPPVQKSRQRSLDSFVNAIEKMDAALAELDSAALGWLYANVVDKLSERGVSIGPYDSGIVSMRNHPPQAMVEAGEMRAELRKLAGCVVDAASEARKTLPLSERVENDPRLKTAKALERQIIENGIEFSTSETGFPAQCLRAIFELGGLDVEKVSHWLKKVADDPDSFARFRQRMQEKTEGKNPPAL